MNIKTAIDWLLYTIHSPSRIINKKICEKEVTYYDDTSDSLYFQRLCVIF